MAFLRFVLDRRGSEPLLAGRSLQGSTTDASHLGVLTSGCERPKWRFPVFCEQATVEILIFFNPLLPLGLPTVVGTSGAPISHSWHPRCDRHGKSIDSESFLPCHSQNRSFSFRPGPAATADERPWVVPQTCLSGLRGSARDRNDGAATDRYR